MNASLHRRSTASARLRENRPQSSNTGNNTANPPSRRKSRSPECRNDDGVPKHRFSRFMKQKHVVQSDNVGTSRPSSTAVAGEERGRNSKQSLRPRRQQSAEGDAHLVHDNQTTRRHGRARKKEGSPSRDVVSSATHMRTCTATDPDDMDVIEERLGLGSLAAVDHVRMRDEIESLKKHIAAAKKTIGKQSKTIDDLKRDAADAHKLHNEERQQVARLKAEVRKNSEIVLAVEANLACQICMELLLKPYGLSPCGHVLCLACLQSWFRTTPGEEDMDDQDDADAVLFKKKSCPVCRAEVFHRPIPLFVIKAIASVLDKAKQGGPRRPSSPLADGDPWAGIFPAEISPYDEQEDSDSDWNTYYDLDDEGAYEDSEDGQGPFPGYGSDTDDEFYDSEYVSAHWQPPTVDVNVDDYPFEEIDDGMLSMLRRGATVQMITLFHMSYSHEEGLIALLDDNEVYLGWNICLKPDDETGEEYMDWVEADIVNHPERWDKEEHGNCWTAWRLIRNGEEDEFDLTDSEMWAEELADLHAGL